MIGINIDDMRFIVIGTYILYIIVSCMNAHDEYRKTLQGMSLKKEFTELMTWVLIVFKSIVASGVIWFLFDLYKKVYR